jgi:hypothetical protein
MPELTRQQKITFGEMRAAGVRGRLVDLGWLTSSATNISDVEYNVTEKGQTAAVEE